MSKRNEPLWDRCSTSTLAERAAILLGCYKRDEAADPEIYTRGVISVLSEYPHWCVVAVTEPRSGLPSKIKWLPSLAEIKEACEEQVGHLRRNAERAENEAAAFKALPAPGQVTEESRARVDAIVEKYKEDVTGRSRARDLAEAKAFTDSLEAQIARGESPMAKVVADDLARRAAAREAAE